MKKKLIICYIPHSYSISFTQFKKIVNNLNNNSIFVSFDLHSQRLLEDIGMSYKRAASYLQEKEIEATMQEIFKYLCSKWSTFKINSQDNLYIEAVEKISQWKTVQIYYLLSLLEKIISCELPDEILLITENSILKRACLELITLKKLKHSVINLKGFILINVLSKVFKFLQMLYKFCGNQNKPKNKLSNKKDKLLFINYCCPNNATKTIFPIIDKLKEQYEVIFIVDGKDNHKKELVTTLRKRNLSCFRVEDYSFLNRKYSIYHKKNDEVDSEKRRELFNYKGINLLNIYKPLKSLYFPPLDIQTIEYFINIHKPKALIVSEEQSLYGRLASSVAKKNNIPVISLPEDIYQIPRFLPSLNPLLCDKLLVSGKAVKEHLIEAGLDPFKIYVSGTAKWDELVTRKNFLAGKELCEKLKLDPNKSIWLFTGQGLIDEPEKINMLISIMKMYPNKQLLIKIHPCKSGFLEKIQILFSKTRNITVIKKFDLWELIANCEILITATSATAIDAMLLKKPVIILNTDFLPYPWFYIKEEAAVSVNSKEQLISAINKITSDKMFRNNLIKKGESYAYRYTNNLDGKSQKRIIDLIKQTINQQLAATTTSKIK